MLSARDGRGYQRLSSVSRGAGQEISRRGPFPGSLTGPATGKGKPVRAAGGGRAGGDVPKIVED